MSSFTNISDAWQQAAGSATEDAGISLNQLAASLVVGLVAFGAFFLVFYLLRQKFARIYAPTTYLVPERQRFLPPPSGWFKWVKPVFETKRRPFIEKCGLDAYCFVRFLFMELKMFFPLMLVVLPIIIPLNSVGINNPSNNGLDEYGWGNIGTSKTHRYTGHLVIAILVIIWVCYVFYEELINYIQERQRWMTSPSHRIRASATTVLVSNIPDKWCSVESLDALFDAFPGGIRNIWINRDYGELLDKKKKQLEIARKLEGAETNLIRNCKRKALELRAKDEKKTGKKKTQAEKDSDDAFDQRQAEQMANDAGLTTGSPNLPHNVDEELDEALDDATSVKSHRRLRLPIPLVGEGLEAMGRGFGTLGHGVGRGFNTIGHGVGKLGHDTAEGVIRGFGRARADVDKGLAAAEPVGYFPATDGADEIPEEAGALGPSKDHLHRGAPDKSPRTRDYLHRGPVERRTSSHGTFRTPTMQSSASPNPSIRRPQPEPVVESEADSRHPNPLESKADAHHLNPLERKADSHHLDPLQSKAGSHNLNPLRLFRRNSEFPSPEPFHTEEDEFPLSRPSPNLPSTSVDLGTPAEVTDAPAETEAEKKERDKYAKKPPIIDWPEYRAQLLKETEEAEWTKYLKPSDRETMRLSLFPRCNWWWKIWPTWWFSLGKKVDVITYCRLQLIELNKEIEEDEKNLDRYPLMNSAFIQFNHQVAAHMACQSVTHHRPKNMGPRILEIDPKDVIWDNLSTPWWNANVRTMLVIALIIGIIIMWAVPMAFVGLLSQLDSISSAVTWLHWVANIPSWLKAVIQGALPPALQSVLLILLPFVIRLLVRFTSVPTGVECELETQGYWFLFLFVQVFLVVTLSSGLTTVLQQLVNSPLSVPDILAENLPKGANYFFSYLLLQALYGASQQLAQLSALFVWFVLGRAVDDTARAKFNRQKHIPNTMWGTLFPVHTNFACIVLIYSVIAPLILIFGTVVAALFWVVYRYNSFYVNRWNVDSGGLYFPRAVNQLFTGVYVMELCLIGLFFLVRNEQKEAACVPHAIVMIVIGILTIIYQYMLNKALGPLFKFVPITMEDEAQFRQEEFEATLAERWAALEAEEAEETEEASPSTVNTAMEEKNGSIEMKSVKKPISKRLTGINKPPPSPDSRPKSHSRQHHHHHDINHSSSDPPNSSDPEQGKAPQNSGFLFQGYHDELEDLTPEERDVLVRKAFEHQALRMSKPCIWIPRDEFGISNDEIRRTAALRDDQEDEEKFGIWITNQYASLDAKARVIFKRPPPDFNSSEEFMQL